MRFVGWMFLCLLAAVAAVIAEDGQIGATSTGKATITITIPERVRTVTPDGTPIITDYANYEIKKEGEVFIIRPKAD